MPEPSTSDGSRSSSAPDGGSPHRSQREYAPSVGSHLCSERVAMALFDWLQRNDSPPGFQSLLAQVRAGVAPEHVRAWAFDRVLRRIESHAEGVRTLAAFVTAANASRAERAAAVASLVWATRSRDAFARFDAAGAIGDLAQEESARSLVRTADVRAALRRSRMTVRCRAEAACRRRGAWVRTPEGRCGTSGDSAASRGRRERGGLGSLSGASSARRTTVSTPSSKRARTPRASVVTIVAGTTPSLAPRRSADHGTITARGPTASSGPGRRWTAPRPRGHPDRRHYRRGRVPACSRSMDFPG